MSEKRKFEDLLDPDYPQSAKLIKTEANHSQQLSRDERINRIRSIVNREFQRELTAKEQEILEIDDRIQLARKLLKRVRYAVVSNYYSKKGMELPDSKAQECVESLNLKSTAPPVTERDQYAVHPALKGILGKKSVDFEEILKARPTREAAKTAKTCIKEKLRTKKEEKRLQRAMNGAMNIVISHDTPAKMPRHVEPNKVEMKIPQINKARSGNQTKHLIAVGNTSKYIGDEKFVNGVTHKWLVYVKTKTPVPIEKLVTKVRFFLHPSYRPHDIVDVFEPPFQIAERGWGEFPIRLQLFFEPSLQQKPVQLMHNLVLDKSMSGLQTMGAETLVEIWLRTDHLQINNQLNTGNKTPKTSATTDDENSQISEDNVMDHIDDKLMEFLTRIENQTSKSLCEEDERIEPTINVPSTNPVELNLNLKESNYDSIENTNLYSTPYGEATTNIKQENNRIVVTNIKQENNRMDVDSKEIDHHKSDGLKRNAGLSNSNNLQNNSHVLSSLNTVVVKQEPINSAPDNLANKICDVEIVPPDKAASSCNNNQINLAQPTSTSHESVSNVDAAKLSLTAPVNALQTKPQILQKRIFKCIDKKGNVKYVEMFIKSPIQQNGHAKIALPGTGLVQKAVFISKVNGQMKDGQTNPVIFKISPSNSIVATNTTTTSSTVTKLITQSKSSPINLVTQTAKVVSTTTPSQIPSVLKTPATKENQSNLPPYVKCTLNSTNKNQVMVKNGKMYIIDPLQAKIKQQTKKQESLLKPQVSLLKPIVKNDNLNNCIRNDPKSVFNHTAIATDHDYTSLIGKPPCTNKVTIHRPSNPQQLVNKQKSSIVTVSSPNNSRINVIVTKLDDDDDDEEHGGGKGINESGIKFSMKSSIMSKSTALMQKPRKDYHGELEMIFRARKLTNVCQAVNFLLKRLPLINNKATSIDYSLSFPFVVKNQLAFDRLMTPKLKANEWLRAKYIQRLLQKHPKLSASEIWTTKEIIIFARLHAYTPVIKYRIGKELNASKAEMDSTLKDLVKKEIKREKYDIQTISLVHDTYDWINDTRLKIKEELNANEEVIDIDGCDDDDDNNEKSTKEHELTQQKNMSRKCFILPDASGEPEVSFVNDACQQIGIRLKPEEIATDVLYPASQLVLAQCLKSFLEDLLRRSAACRPDVVGSPIVESVIKPDDIKNAILSRPQWDFLTNDGLGVARPKEQKQ